jgi:hypothetical protein
MAYKDKEKAKQYRLKNKEKIKIVAREYHLKNKEKRNKQSRENYLKNKEQILAKHKEYRINTEYSKKRYWKNKKQELKRNKEYRLKNKEKLKKQKKEYYLKNKEKIKEKGRKYSKNNRDKINVYFRHRFKTKPNFKIRQLLGNRIRKVLKGINKSASTMELIDCTIEELWIHLESKFKPWMTRENYGLWHVDHIIPCANFDLTDLEQQKKCFHYTNLQPLWAHENYSKGAKIISGDIISPKM